MRVNSCFVCKDVLCHWGSEPFLLGFESGFPIQAGSGLWSALLKSAGSALRGAEEGCGQCGLSRASLCHWMNLTQGEISLRISLVLTFQLVGFPLRVTSEGRGQSVRHAYFHP